LVDDVPVAEVVPAPVPFRVLLVVAVGVAVGRPMLHGDIVNLRGQAVVKGDVHPAHALKPEVDDDPGGDVRPLSEEEHHRKLLFVYAAVVDDHDLFLWDVVVVSDRDVEILDAVVPARDPDVPLGVCG